MCPFRLADLDYDLPQTLIAQAPAERRDSSRLLIVDRPSGTLRDASFSDLPESLRSGDTLVINDTRVVPAKITARRGTGARIGGLFVREWQIGRWELLLQGRGRLRQGETLALVDPASDERVASLELTESRGEGHWLATVEPAVTAEALLTRVGRTPLPPYIRRDAIGDPRDAQDRQRYQTVYARQAGAVAAPTAGLHFTEPMLHALGHAGLSVVRTTLHVGLGTFAPIKVDRLETHEMHREWYDLSPDAAAVINRGRRAGHRIIAVGTTSVRVLETCANSDGTVAAGSGWTDLFCYPPYRFKAVDVLLTNFHLPRSTLLALIMAFAGIGLTRHAYRHAVDRGYRFFSYGDAMLIV